MPIRIYPTAVLGVRQRAIPHTMGETAASWEPVPADLANLRCRAIALDARGHGDGDRPEAYSYELLRNDVLDVLEALRIDRCVLFGHSTSATTAYGRCPCSFPLSSTVD